MLWYEEPAHLSLFQPLGILWLGIGEGRVSSSRPHWKRGPMRAEDQQHKVQRPESHTQSRCVLPEVDSAGRGQGLTWWEWSLVPARASRSSREVCVDYFHCWKVPPLTGTHGVCTVETIFRILHTSLNFYSLRDTWIRGKSCFHFYL